MAQTFISEEWNIESTLKSTQRFESNRFHVGCLKWYIQLQKVEDQLSFSLHLDTQLSGESRLVLFTLSISDDQQRSRRATNVPYAFTKKKRVVKLVDVHAVGDNLSLKLTYKLQVIDRERHYKLLSCLEPKYRQELFLQEHLVKDVEYQLKAINKDGKDKLRAFIEKHWPSFSNHWETLDQASRYEFSTLKLRSDMKGIVSYLLETLEVKNMLVVECLCCVGENLKRPKSENDATDIWIDKDENLHIDTHSFLVLFKKASEASTGTDGKVGTLGNVLKLAKHAIELLVFDRAISLYEHQINRKNKAKRATKQGKCKIGSERAR